MAKMKWVGKVCEITGMSIAGGDLPEGFSVKLNVRLDCDVPWDMVKDYVAGGSSARVVMQTTLRGLDTKTLRELEKREWINVKVTDIKDADAFLNPDQLKAKRMANIKAMLAGMSKEDLKAILEGNV